jgi:hypothetical protein
MKKYKWVVEFEVTENLVDDGFEIDNDVAQEMIQSVLAFAYWHEFNAKVISKSVD